VTREADLKVTKTGPVAAVAGTFVTYTVAVENLGPSDNSASTLNDTWSAELQGAKYCTGAACDPAAGSSWSGSLALAGINAGDTTTVKIRAQIKPSSTVTTLSNTASVSGQSPTDPVAGNNSDTTSATVTREADLKVTKTGPVAAVAGTFVTYTVAVENLGPSDNSASTLNDTLSAELQGAKYCTGAACDPAAGSSWSGSLALAGINAGDTTTVKIRAQIKPSSTVTTLSNTASVSGQSPTDPVAGNNSDTTSATVTREADLK